MISNTELNQQYGMRPYCSKCGTTVGYDLKAHQKRCLGTGKHHKPVIMEQPKDKPSKKGKRGD